MLIRGFATIVFLFALAAFSAVTVKADAFVSVRVYDLTSQMCRDNPNLPQCVIDHNNVRGPISITDTVVVPTATASAAADLRDGTLRLLTSVVPTGLGGSLASAGIVDQLTFISAPGGPSVFDVTIGINVHGSISGSAGDVDAILTLSGQNERRIYSGDGTYSDTFSLTLTGVQSGVVRNFMAQLGVQGSFTQGTRDFSNTANVFLILPTGVTFTSQSGAFLTQTPTAVPEPATMLLLGSGLAGIAAKRFKRRKVH